ncbi:MAG TPA: hypothetical protein PK059_09205 [Cyclobacteriaceae bacterium]|nr:hypothetical protein [Cyclobacteriaceae bacterium]
MNQRPLIYVHRITNLSDARYCAGMGVDMLGFVVDPSDPDYVTPKLYQDMIGWISGPKRVIEWRSASSPDWDELLDVYKPDLIHLPLQGMATAPALPLMVEIDASDLPLLKSNPNITHLVIRDGLNVQAISGATKLPALLSVPGNINSQELLQRTGAAGLALQGSNEVAPGLKDYDHLALILEALED